MLEVISSPLASLHNMRELGGPVVTWIFIACLIMWTIVIERYWYFRKQLPRDAAAMLAQWNQRVDAMSGLRSKFAGR